MVFTLVARLVLVVIYLFVYSRQLVVAGYQFYTLQYPAMSMHHDMVEGAGGLPLAGLLAEMSDCFMHNMCVYLVCEA